MSRPVSGWSLGRAIPPPAGLFREGGQSFSQIIFRAFVRVLLNTFPDIVWVAWALMSGHLAHDWRITQPAIGGTLQRRCSLTFPSIPDRAARPSCASLEQASAPFCVSPGQIHVHIVIPRHRAQGIRGRPRPVLVRRLAVRRFQLTRGSVMVVGKTHLSENTI